MFGVTILGNNSAIPAYDRHPTSQVVTMNDQLFLIDCGEGTQMQLTRYKIKRSRINHIFISHLHGDHYFGLIGLLTSFGLSGRLHDLHLYAPAPLQKIIQLQLEAADTILPFQLFFHTLKQEKTLVETERFSIDCFKVFHRIECWGFIIREKKRKRKLLRDKALQKRIPPDFFEDLKDGLDYVSPNGDIIKNEEVTTLNVPAKSYAFCADTLFKQSIAESIKNVHTVYHESTYLSCDEAKAVSRFHCTSTQAATIAKLANAQQLIIGHFSSKYEKLDDFLNEAQSIFPNSQLAIEGVTYII